MQQKLEDIKVQPTAILDQIQIELNLLKDTQSRLQAELPLMKTALAKKIDEEAPDEEYVILNSSITHHDGTNSGFESL